MHCTGYILVNCKYEESDVEMLDSMKSYSLRNGFCVYVDLNAGMLESNANELSELRINSKFNWRVRNSIKTNYSDFIELKIS